MSCPNYIVWIDGRYNTAWTLEGAQAIIVQAIKNGSKEAVIFSHAQSRV